jgi:hypothetical protein
MSEDDNIKMNWAVNSKLACDTTKYLACVRVIIMLLYMTRNYVAVHDT